ncbi:MAG: DUF6265 family protein [Wenzhouxiangellaceae bacterium]|nr:DUF6265 family protein [Wenzhouxiangellaceae bacterium]
MAAVAPARSGDCESLSSAEPWAGGWTTSDGGFAERWVRVGPGTFEGIGTAMERDGARVESLRLVEMSGRLYYIAKVEGNAMPTVFALSDCGPDRWTFRNDAHDFPKRIEYVFPAPDRMRVTVDDGAGEGFTLELVRDEARESGAAAQFGPLESRAPRVGDAPGMAGAPRPPAGREYRDVEEFLEDWKP